MKAFLLPLLAAASLATLSVPVSAKEVRFEVEYTDLNLATAKGQETLDRRIVNAARKACGVRRQAKRPSLQLSIRLASAAGSSNPSSVSHAVRSLACVVEGEGAGRAPISCS